MCKIMINKILDFSLAHECELRATSTDHNAESNLCAIYVVLCLHRR